MIKNKVATGSSVHAFTIPYDDIEIPAQNIQLPFPTPAGSLVMVAVSLTYYVFNKRELAPTNQVAFMPSAIVGAMYV
jgi:hypothetical protein